MSINFSSIRLMNKILKCIPKNIFSYQIIYYSYQRMYNNYAINSSPLMRNCDNYYLIDIQKYFCSNALQKMCWRCKKPLEKLDPFCNSCNVIQQLDNVNTHFNIIGIQENYKINMDELRKKYKYLQTRLHPDKFANSSDEEKRLSDDWSSAVNKAYDILKNPLKRGLYILKLRGETIDNVRMEPQFLGDVMQKHEEAEDAEDLTKVTELYEANNKIMEMYIEQIVTAFDEKNIEKAKHLLAEMKYYESIQTDLKNKLTRFHGKL